MMNCHEIREHFDERLDGRMTGPVQAEFDAHVTTCAECRSEWRAYAGVWEALGLDTGVEPSFGFVERTLRRLEQEPAKTHSWFWRPVVRYVTLGAAVVALVIGGWNEHQSTLSRKRAEVYAGAQQSDYLEDFDVIANLDQIEGAHHL
jgi:predicted anti-sigma-YlaC factor YlaD